VKALAMDDFASTIAGLALRNEVLKAVDVNPGCTLPEAHEAGGDSFQEVSPCMRKLLPA